MVKAMINEDRLLGLIQNYFQRPEQVVIEICQNAQRSKASKIEISYDADKGTLEFQDNGLGADKCLPLFILAESDWSEDIEQQNPAGWGNFFLLSISTEVTYRSSFGSIVVDCERFLNDREYRYSLPEMVEKENTYQGFYGFARLKTPININRVKEELGYHSSCEIVLNGEIIKADIEKIMKRDIVCTYEGNEVGINIDRWQHVRSQRDYFADQLSVIWYGIPIGITSRFYFRDKTVVINVKEGSPLTPVLPYRQAIQEDEKLEKFYDFCVKKVIEHCIEKINHSDTKGDRLQTYMRVLEMHGSQEELDSLSQYYTSSHQPFFNTSTDFWIEESIDYIKRPETGNVVIKSKVLKEVRDDGEVMTIDGSGEPDIILPKGVFKVQALPERHPSWLCAETENYVLNIARDKKKPYLENYVWVKSKITLEGEGVISELKSAAITVNYDTTIYYAESARDVYEIEDVIFARSYYDSDGDTLDTQRNDFLADLQEDIYNVDEKYDRSALLSGLSPYVKSHNVLNIKITRKTMLVTLKRGVKKVFALT